MSQWEYVIKEFRLIQMADEPDDFSTGDGSILPREKQELLRANNVEMITELTSFGGQIQYHLNELGEDGWEVFHIEKKEVKQAWYSKIKEAEYRLWAKRRIGAS